MLVHERKAGYLFPFYYDLFLEHLSGSDPELFAGIGIEAVVGDEFFEGLTVFGYSDYFVVFPFVVAVGSGFHGVFLVSVDFSGKRYQNGMMIVKKKNGYFVLSKKTKRNLGGPYQTREEALKRLRQVEFFKRQK